MNSSQNDITNASIVIVDDTPANLRLLTGMLSQQGFEVRPIPSGKLALTAIKTSPPDLILLDINMPAPNGYEVCQQLKANEQTCDIPVIFISALDEVIDKIRAFAVGGIDYITKPFQIEEVLARINTHLTLHLLQKQLKQTNTDLSSSNSALQASNDELNAFGHTVAHDLKNPLGVIIGSIDYLMYGGPELPYEVVEDTLHRIKNSSLKLNNIIDELLLLAGVRKQDVQLSPLDMPEIVSLAQQRLMFMADEYQGEIKLPTQWPTAQGYAPWIEEVWVNYISNGLKYGGSPPQLQLGASSQPDGFIRFWIRDNGPGITATAQKTLFTEFTRLEHTRAQGHGLGLSIVQRIIKKLGGQVGLDSEPGKGSTFFFTLPS